MAGNIASPFAEVPLTLDGSGEPGEKTFSANVGAPANTAAANCWKIEKTRDGLVLECGRTWQLTGRISGTSPENADVTVLLWAFDRNTGEKYPLAKMRFVGVNLIADDLSNTKDMVSRIGTGHLGAEVIGLGGDHELHLVHYEVTP